MSKFSKLTFKNIVPFLKISKNRPFTQHDLTAFVDIVPIDEKKIEILLRCMQDTTYSLNSALAKILVLLNGFFIIKTISLVCFCVVLSLGSTALMRLFLIAITEITPDIPGAKLTVSIKLICLVLATLTAWLVQNHVFDLSMQLGLRVRDLLVDSVLSHLKKSAQNARQLSDPIMVPLLTRDLAVVQKGAEFAPIFLLCFLIIIVASAMLYQLLGIVSLVGLSVLLALIITSRLLLRRVGILSGKLSSAAKKRYSLIGFFFEHFNMIRARHWKDYIGAKILNARAAESVELSGVFRQLARSFIIFFSTPILVTLVSFSSVAFFTGTLKGEVVFPVIAIIGILRSAFYNFPDALFSMVRAYEALGRFSELFHEKPQASEEAMVLGLENLDLKMPRLIAIVGPNGGGKTTLLHQAMQLLASAGKPIGFLPQVPLAFEGSIASNIALGIPFQKSRIQEALGYTLLDQDLKQLATDEDYLVVQGGENLSGGQKQRLALAKLIYADPEVLILDDPLSAQDNKVAASVFHTCFKSLWAHRLILMTTSNFDEAIKADFVVIVENHKIVSKGTPEQMINETEGFMGQWVSKKRDSWKMSEKSIGLNQENNTISKEVRLQETTSDTFSKTDTDKLQRLSWSHFINVLAQPVVILLIISLFILREIAAVGGDLWLSSATLNQNMSRMETFEFTAWWVVLAFLSTLLTGLSASALLKTVHKATNKLHEQLLKKVLHAKLTDIERIPKSQHLSRFIYDQRIIDETLGPWLMEFLASTFALIAGLSLILYKMPSILLGVFPLTLLYYHYQKSYRRSNRLLGLIESDVNANFLSGIKEGMNNLWALSYLGQEDFSLTKIRKTNYLVSTAHAVSTKLERWFSIRVEEIGGILYCGTAFIASLYWWQGIPFNASNGIVLAYASSLTAHYGRCIRMLSCFEKSLSSVGQFSQYENLVDADQNKTTTSLDKSQGCRLEVKSLGFTYPGAAAPALKNINFTIEPGQRVGIIGRTGSGKSSLLKLLVGLYDLTEGSVHLNDRNLASIHSKDLSKSIFYLPQRPTFLPGPLRNSLAPSSCNDQLIWLALEKFGVKKNVENLPQALDYLVSEEGKLPLSDGLSQAILLASAILHPCSLVILDESTSSMDSAREDMALRALAAELNNNTTLMISTHRTYLLKEFTTVISLEDGCAFLKKNK